MGRGDPVNRKEAMTQDDAREALSRANTRLGNATHKVWAAQASLDQAEADGDPFEIRHAQNMLLEADGEHERSLREHAAAESALVAAALADGEL